MVCPVRKLRSIFCAVMLVLCLCSCSKTVSSHPSWWERTFVSVQVEGLEETSPNPNSVWENGEQVKAKGDEILKTLDPFDYNRVSVWYEEEEKAWVVLYSYKPSEEMVILDAGVSIVFDDITGETVEIDYNPYLPKSE